MLTRPRPAARTARSSTSSACPTPKRAGQRPGVCGPWLVRRSSSSRTCRCRSTGGCGRRAPRCATPGGRCTSSARRAPSGTPSRTPRSTGCGSTATRCAPPPAARSATSGVRLRALAHLPAGPNGRPGGRRARLQPAGPVLPGRPGVLRRGRAVRVRPARPGAGAVPVAVRAAARTSSTARSCRLERRPTAPPTSSSRPTRATARSRSAGAASARRTCSWCAARPRSNGSTQVAPDRRSSRGKPYLLCYLGVMGPQDGVDYALRALAELRDELGRTDWHAAFVGGGDTFDAMVAAVPRARPGGLRRLHRAHPGRGPAALPVHRRRVPVARPAQPAQRRVHDEQGHGVHGDGRARSSRSTCARPGSRQATPPCTRPPTTSRSSPS